MAYDDFSFEVIKDFGAFGEGKWQKHLTLLSFNGKPPKYDIRPWNDDMSKMGKGVSLDLEDLMDLQEMFSVIIDSDEDESEAETEEVEATEEEK